MTTRLIKIGYENEVSEGQHVMKEAYDRALVLTRSEDVFECYEIPDTSSYGSSDSITKVSAIPGSKQLAVIRDVDDEGRRALWIRMSETNTPMKVAPAKAKAPTASSYGTGAAPADAPAPTGEPPSPLIPFAGCDRKAMPPSPAKPFSPQASPLKPSPLKERIDTATQAVAQKHWTQKQSKMNGLFGSNAVKPPQPPQQQAALTHGQVQPLRAAISDPDAMDA